MHIVLHFWLPFDYVRFLFTTYAIHKSKAAKETSEDLDLQTCTALATELFWRPAPIFIIELQMGEDKYTSDLPLTVQ